MTEVILGFVISVAIALTGVGAGSLTTPLLILLLGLPAAECVGTSLIFGAVVKLITAPLYWVRGQVNWRALVFLLATGSFEVAGAGWSADWSGGWILFRGIGSAGCVGAAEPDAVEFGRLPVDRFLCAHME